MRGNSCTAFWETLQIYTGKHYSNYLGSLTYIRWESRRGTLAAEHTSCPGCVCEDSPTCRRHHKCKQAPAWELEQPEPGVMRWTTPAGPTYTTRPTVYEL
jgi:hypothetical protein